MPLYFCGFCCSRVSVETVCVVSWGHVCVSFISSWITPLPQRGGFVSLWPPPRRLYPSRLLVCAPIRHWGLSLRLLKVTEAEKCVPPSSSVFHEHYKISLSPTGIGDSIELLPSKITWGGTLSLKGGHRKKLPCSLGCWWVWWGWDGMVGGPWSRTSWPVIPKGPQKTILRIPAGTPSK